MWIGEELEGSSVLFLKKKKKKEGGSIFMRNNQTYEILYKINILKIQLMD